MFFFFQAEDGIRDDLVTGVQTCALPISNGSTAMGIWLAPPPMISMVSCAWAGPARSRSEERRVGKECRSRWWPDHQKKTPGTTASATPGDWFSIAATSLVKDETAPARV